MFEKSESTAVKIVVNDCVPHRNPEYPWAFNPTGNYHQYKYGLNPDGTTNICRPQAFCEKYETVKYDGNEMCTTSLGRESFCCTAPKQVNSD